MKRKSQRLAENTKKRRFSSTSSDSLSEKDSSSDDEDNEYEEDDEEDEEDDDLITYVTDDDILEQLKKTDRKTYDKFIEVKNVIDNSIPDITAIINEDMSINNKARIVELYEVFKLTEPLTEEWLLLKDRLNMLIIVYKEEYININSEITIKNKLILIELYQMFSTMLPFTEEWFTLRNRLNSMTKEFIDEYKHTKNIDQDKINSETAKLEGGQSNCTINIKQQIINLNASHDNKVAIMKRFNEIRPGSCSEETNKLKKWIRCAVDLPHNNMKKIKGLKTFISKVAAKLDKELYGMNSVKEQILIFLNNRITNPKMKGCCLGLKGPPGVGKTTIARILAKVMGWPFEQISFGGVSNAEFLKGHDFTYVGSRPGEIARCLTRMQYKNGILFFDEFEKVADNKQILASLLHITDFQQNHEFVDNYLADLKIDLSNLWFIYSMNNLPVDSALRDRLFIIELDGYNLEEKINILIKHSFPKLLDNMGMKKGDVSISEDVAKYIINKFDEGNRGIRNLENVIKELMSKINFLVRNKNLKELSCITFSSECELTYPLKLTIEIVDDLMKKSGDTGCYGGAKPPFGMYL
jgi:ATP-dependent Lon protease